MAFVTGAGSTAGLADPLVNILFSSKMHVQTQGELFFNKAGLMKKEDGGEDPYERKADSPIVVKDEFGKERGQRIRLALRKALDRNVTGITNRSGSSNNLNQYTYGTTSMIDQEEGLALHDMEVVVELMKHAVGFDTPELQDLKTNFRMEQEAAGALADWLTGQYEESILDALYDGNAAHVIRSGFATAYDHPRRVWGNNATEQADISNDDNLDAAELRSYYQTLRLANVNPIKFEGREMYVMLAHVYSVSDLKADTTVQGNYQNAYTRTEASAANPMFGNADIIFEGIAVHEYNRIRRPVSDSNNGASTRRNLILGADAVVCGNASEPRLVRRKEDAYEDKYGVGIKQIFGCARADFAQHDEAPSGSNAINQSSMEVFNWAAA